MLKNIIPRIFQHLAPYVVCMSALLSLQIHNAIGFQINFSSDTGSMALGSTVNVSWDLTGSTTLPSDIGVIAITAVCGDRVFQSPTSYSMYNGPLPVATPARPGVYDSSTARFIHKGQATGSASWRITNYGCNFPVKYCLIGGLKVFHAMRAGRILDTCSSSIPTTPTPSTCTINGGQDINVNFGNVDRNDIGTGPEGSLVQTKNLTISCQGNGVQNFSIRMQSTPASWNNNAIQSSNKNVGIATTFNGRAITNGTTMNMAVNGSSSANLTFTPVRGAGSDPSNIATGAFTASTTLIVTQQ